MKFYDKAIHDINAMRIMEKIPIKEFNSESSLEMKAKILEDNDKQIDMDLKGKRAKDILGNISQKGVIKGEKPKCLNLI